MADNASNDTGSTSVLDPYELPLEEDYPVDDGDLPIHKAAADGHTDILESLLVSGGDVDVWNEGSVCTPLHLAIRGNHAEAVRILLSAGANPALEDSLNLAYQQRYDAVSLAARCGSQHAMSALIDHGLGVPAHSLSLAAELNHVECLHVILAALGKDAASDASRVEAVRAALFRAAFCWHLETVNFFLTHVAGFPDSNKAEDREALGVALIDAVNDKHDACDDRCRWWKTSKGSRPIAEALIAAGADVNYEDPVLHITPFWACTGQSDLIRLFLEHGLRLDSRSTIGQTPLFGIMSNEDTHVMVNEEDGLALLKNFMAAKADVKAKDVSMATPLHFAAHRSFAEVVFMHGADVFAKDTQGKTPLHSACQGLRLSVVEFLLEKNASVDEHTFDGHWTPLLYAILGSDPHMSSSPLEVIRILTTYGANIHATTIDGRTALHEAARRSDKEVVRYLIEQGVDIHATTADDTAALHFACSHYQFKTKADIISTATLLMDHGANIEATDSTGATPLRLAFARHLDTQGNTPDLINTLLQRGADRSALGNGGIYIGNPLDSRKWFWDNAGLLRENPHLRLSHFQARGIEEEEGVRGEAAVLI
jgi:ankyrin repeat protein